MVNNVGLYYSLQTLESVVPLAVTISSLFIVETLTDPLF